MRFPLDTLDLRVVTGLEFRGETPVKVRCREHDDVNASLAVYRHNLVCFGCGFKINRVLDALAYLLYGEHNEETVLKLARDHTTLARYTTSAVGGGCPPKKEHRTARTPTIADVEVYEQVLWSVRRGRVDWLLARGLTEDTIRSARLGHNGRAFVIPVFSESGELVTLRYRRDDFYGVYLDEGHEREVPKYFGWRGSNTPTLYPLPWVGACGGKDLWVVEGELDALRLQQEGIPVVTITNGANNLEKVPRLTQLFGYTTFYIAGDQDGPGQRAATLCALAAVRGGYEVVMVYFDAKDITEFLKEHTIEEAEYVRLSRVSYQRYRRSGGGSAEGELADDQHHHYSRVAGSEDVGVLACSPWAREGSGVVV